MNSDYQKLLRWSESNKKKLTKGEDLLKRQKRPDSIMQELHATAFESIDCLECANCCKTTGPMLTPQDVERISKAKKISETKFIDFYLKYDEDGDLVFKSMPCPFLMNDNHCEIYQIRPRACREFPHTDQKGQINILSLTRKNAKICPAVAKIYQMLAEL
ncbi:MAG: YkgJ family cysteine cluster protein [Flavobacteriales bacterium]